MRLADGERAKNILDEFTVRSEEIKGSGFVEEKYRAYAAGMLPVYLTALSSVNTHNLIIRIINKLSGYKFSKWLIDKKHNKSKRLAIQNFVECEAHRELLVSGLNNYNRV